MNRINLLDITTSNKIAAGEVIERPFSVVKELIENSIDAHAENISCEIIDGGHKNIKITDDGYGIHPDDIEKAFMTHATSKLTDMEDIYNINTLGFRGEALASIAAVSNVILKSRVQDFDYGREISISGGIIKYIKDAGCSIGTNIEVSDLFFNVPARLKFLKSSQRETSYVSDITSRLALANPKISFKLHSNGKKMISTYGTGNIIDAVRSIYGKNITDNVYYFEDHGDIASVYGYIGNSDICRGSRNNQSIFVNKRYIKSKLITAAVENAFKSFITVNKYPFFIIFIDIYPEFVDVNVHPTKSELKFKDDRSIFKLVFDSVHKALRENLKESFQITTNEFEEDAEESVLQGKTLVQLPIDLKNGVNKIEEFVNTKKEENIYQHFPDYSTENYTKDSFIMEKSSIEAKFPVLYPIGQFDNTYIMAQREGCLYLIDQHAAHEKILFEKYMKELEQQKVVSQILVSPVIIELPWDEYAYYTENILLFKNAGFVSESFGENLVKLTEVPMILGITEIDKLFYKLIDNLKNMGSGKTIEIKYSTIAKTACKSAIKAHDKLSICEMEKLLEELRFIDDPFTCPHGRPTMIKITLNDLEKKFKRIQ